MEIKTESEKTKGTQKPEKQGLVKRFLKWVASGADKSNIGPGSCPS